MTDACTQPIALKLPPSWAWVLVAGLLAHAIVPLTDYVLWDGWWYAADLARPDHPTVMARLFHEVGRPLDMWFYAPLRWIGGNPVTWAKLTGTASWIASAICAGSVLHRLARVPEPIAMAVAALAAAFPIFDLLGELALWMNTACVLLFWLAWALVSRLQDLAGWRAVVIRLTTLALFFISFNLNSNLVMFYAVAAAIMGLRLRDTRPATLLGKLSRVALRAADFLVLPVIFWLWKVWFTPSSGFYATGYNQPSLAPDRLAAGYLAMARDFVFRGLIGFFWSPAWIAVAVLVAFGAAVALRRIPESRALLKPPPGGGLKLVGWGVFLLLAAAFPYVAVGQGLATEGWLTRNCILCPIPVALIVVGFLWSANGWWLRGSPAAWLTGVVAFVVIGVGGCIHNYLLYQAFGAKCWSVREKLTEVIGNDSPAVVQLRDYYHIPHTIPYYPPVIWTYLANGRSGSPTSFVIETAMLAPDVFQPGPDGQPRRGIPTIPLRSDTVDEAITNTTMPYALERVPRRGPQVMAAIQPGHETTPPAALGRRYLVLSWFDPAGRAEFVRGITSVDVNPLPPIE